MFPFIQLVEFVIYILRIWTSKQKGERLKKLKVLMMVFFLLEYFDKDTFFFKQRNLILCGIIIKYKKKSNYIKKTVV